MDALHLSKRLQVVADYVPANARLADIGSDHAYLPANLLLADKISFGIAGEVAKGPLENARQEVMRHRLGDRLEARLADGLAAVTPEDNIDTVVVAGMGGRLISQILEAGHQNGEQYNHLILQPNIDVYVVREWLETHGYQIEAETMLLDEGHYYEIVVAVPGEQSLTSQECHYGPFNIAANDDVWRAKWQREADRIGDVMAQLVAVEKTDTPAYQKYAAQKAEIEEVLAHAGQ
jgi:tRNA (adenine22-N1)-methyltransferase